MQKNNYKKQLANNTIWHAIESYSIIGIQLLCTFILARFLTPTDFGIVGMIVIFTSIGNTLINSGFSQALIRENKVNNNDYSSVFYFNVALSIVLFVILYFSSGLIAKFYNQPILVAICRFTFLILILNALYIVPQTILIRNLQFKKLCIVSLLASIVSCIVAILIAYHTHSVWALVIQNVLAYFLRTIGVWISTRWLPSLYFDFKPIIKLFSFSKNLLISGLIGNIFNNIHSLLIGHYYKPSDLGFYSIADRTKNVASQTSTQVIQSVTYPILSKINNEGNDIKEVYKKIISVTIIFVGCIMSLTMSISFDIFELLMGSEEWRIAGYYLFILGITGILYPLHAVNQNILMVKGLSSIIMKLEIVRRCIMLIILSITVHYDINIFIIGCAAYSFILLFLNLHICGKPINYGLLEQLRDTFPIFIRFAIMITGSLGIASFLYETDILLRVIVTFLTCLFIGFVVFYNNSYIRELINILINKKKTKI